MAQTGSVAPRVVVRPPNLPAPPPISLLTQNNVDDADATIHAGMEGRWEGSAGTTWLEPQRQWQNNQLWQSWPDGAGTAQTNKSMLADGSDPGIPSGVGAADDAPVQRPIIASLIVTEGLLTEWALLHAMEGSVEDQMARALNAVLPRIIERELWTSQEVALANWTGQFRLKTPNVVLCPNTTKLPYMRAMARAEQLAADYGILDMCGGAFIHSSLLLASLLSAQHNALFRSPTGRQFTTVSGCMLVPEPGATGAWSEAGTSFISARPAGAPSGGNTSDGWLFVTPPIRVRLGPTDVHIMDSSPTNTNDRTLLVERAFILESSIPQNHPTSIAVPVDYTTSGV